MVLDTRVLDRHFGDTHVPPTVPAPGAVPGTDALETCVRSMDAPDDQVRALLGTAQDSFSLAIACPDNRASSPSALFAAAEICATIIALRRTTGG